ncbi:DUF4232 domain-containing protein [Nocardioides mangrovicus]|uniref:DUF4232 domain-containing protein n=1 Tax=Nocardioides mangrovicus TaxID=2478913 RepID=A0A3L8NZA3_9ACTN|nr:DUF4232 domain-containing protein [Nocardioides mangrovicus]RLV48510.1 DUF4232 domain-containing protein [Nocardioides mangrovicus]
MRHMLLGTSVALVLAGTLTACGGSGDSSGDSSASATVTETVTPSATASATPTPTASATPTATPTPSATTSSAPAVAGCLTRNLTVTVTDGEGAAGSTYSQLVLTNKGSTPCVTGGFGGVSYVQGESNRQVGAPAQRSGGKVVQLTLQPGGKAVAQLRETDAANYPANRCKLTDTDGLKVFPPNETHPAYVQHPSQACANTAIKTLTISPYKAG